MAAETVETLELEIRTRAESAASKIADLSASVSSFGEKISKYIGDMNSFASALEKIVEATSKLSGIKNIKSVIGSAAMVAGSAKTTSLGKAFKPIVPPVRAADNVTGRTRVANWAGQGARRFNITADELASILNKEYQGTGHNNKDLSTQIQAIRNKVISGDGSAIKDIEKLAYDIAEGAGSKRISDAMQAINSGANGFKYFGVSKKDIAGFGENLETVNKYLANAGASFRFKRWPNKGLTPGIGGVDNNFDEKYGNPEDLYNAINEATRNYNFHKAFLDESHVKNDKELAEHVFGELVDKIYGSTPVENDVVEKAAQKVAQETTAAVKPEIYKELGAASSAGSTTDRAQWEREMEGIRAYSERRREDAAIETLRRSLADNTPELISARRDRAAQIGGLDKYDELFSSGIPGLADRGVAAGLIDENMRQAMLEAAGYASGVKEEVQEAATHAAEVKGEIQGATDAAAELSEKTEEVSKSAEEAESKFGGLKNVLRAIGDTISGSAIGKLGAQLMRIAKMRAMRYAIKEAAAGLKEGISNLYQWSKASNGPFASAMDTIASKSMLAKNSLATAFAPAIQALVPVLSQIISWVNAASNAIAQFLALLGGKTTWTKATETAEEWAKTTAGGASGAGDAIKDLLADWDELNVIQSESSGGGGGGGGGKATNFADMFEETSVFDKWTERFEDIKTIVAAIGAGIATWFIASGIESFLGKLGIAGSEVTNIFNRIRKFAAGGVLLTVAFTLADDIGADIAENGLTLENALAGVGDIIAAGLGGHMVADSLIPGSGVIGTIAGITIAVAIGLNAYVTKKRSMTYAKLAKDSFAQTGIGGFDTAKYKEEVEKELNERIGDLSVSISAFNTYGEAKQNLEDAKKSLQELGEYVYGEKKLTKEQADEFKANWEIVFNAVQQMHESTWGTIEFGIAEAMKTESEEGAKHLKELQGQIIELQRLTGGAQAAWKEEASQISSRIASGKATDEDIQRYSVLMELIGSSDVSRSMAAMSEWADAVNNFDFGRGAEAIENAVSFVNEMGDVYSDATDEVELWGKTQKEAVKAAKEELEAYYNSGFIDEGEYKLGLSLLDEWSGMVDSKVARDKQEIQRMQDETFDAIMGQIVRGYIENQKNGGNGAQYREEIQPLLEALTGTGYELDDANQWMKKGNVISEVFSNIWQFLGGYDKYADMYVNPKYTGEQESSVVLEKPVETSAELEMSDSEIKEEILEPIQDVLNENPLTVEVDDSVRDGFTEKDGVWGWDLSGGIPKSAIIASAGASDVNFGGRSTSWYTEPSEPIDVNATGSGMALDSTVGTLEATVSARIVALEGLVERANKILSNVEAYSKQTANKDWTVNINPSTGFARTMSISNNRLAGVTGNP